MRLKPDWCEFQKECHTKKRSWGFPSQSFTFCVKMIMWVLRLLYCFPFRALSRTPAPSPIHFGFLDLCKQQRVLFSVQQQDVQRWMLPFLLVRKYCTNLAMEVKFCLYTCKNFFFYFLPFKDLFFIYFERVTEG